MINNSIVKTITLILAVIFTATNIAWSAPQFSLRPLAIIEQGGHGKATDDPAAAKSTGVDRRGFLRTLGILTAAGVVAPGTTLQALGADNKVQAKDELEILGDQGRIDSYMRILIEGRAKSASLRRRMDTAFKEKMNQLLSQYYKASADNDKTKQSSLWQALAKTTRDYLKGVQELTSKDHSFIKSHPFKSKFGPKHPLYGRVVEPQASLEYAEKIAAYNHAMAQQERELNDKLLDQGILFLPEAGRNLSAARESCLLIPGRPALSKEQQKKVLSEHFAPLIDQQLKQKNKLLDAEIVHLEFQKKRAESEIAQRLSKRTTTVHNLEKEVGVHKANIKLLRAQQHSITMLQQFRKISAEDTSPGKEKTFRAQQALNRAVIAEQDDRVSLAGHRVDYLSKYRGRYIRGELPEWKEKRERELELATIELERHKVVGQTMRIHAALGSSLSPSISERNEGLLIDQEYGERLVIFQVMVSNRNARNDADTLARQIMAAEEERKEALMKVHEAWISLIDAQRRSEDILSDHTTLSRNMRSLTQPLHVIGMDGRRALTPGLAATPFHTRLTGMTTLQRIRMQAGYELDFTQTRTDQIEGGIRYFQERQRQVQDYLRGSAERYNDAVVKWFVGSHRRDVSSYFDIESLTVFQEGLENKPSSGYVSKLLTALEANEARLLELEKKRVAAEIADMTKVKAKKSRSRRKDSGIFTPSTIEQYIGAQKATGQVIDSRAKVVGSKTAEETKSAFGEYEKAQTNQATRELEFAKAMLERISPLAKKAVERAAGRNERLPVTGGKTKAEYLVTLENFWKRRVAELTEAIEKKAVSDMATALGHPTIKTALEIEEKPPVGKAKVKGRKEPLLIMLSDRLRRADNGKYVKGAIRPTGRIVRDKNNRWLLEERLVQRRGKLDGKKVVNYDEIVSTPGAVPLNSSGLTRVAYQEGMTIVDEQQKELGVDPENEARITKEYPDPTERAKHRKYLVAHYLYVVKDVEIEGTTERMRVPVGVGIRSVSGSKRHAKLTGGEVINGDVEFEKIIDITEADTYEKSTKTQKTTTDEIRFYYVPANPRLGKPAVIEREGKQSRKAAADTGAGVVAAGALATQTLQDELRVRRSTAAGI